jgi:hypothetical protein
VHVDSHVQKYNSLSWIFSIINNAHFDISIKIYQLQIAATPHIKTKFLSIVLHIIINIIRTTYTTIQEARESPLRQSIR